MVWVMTVVKINALDVPADKAEELERRFAARQRKVEGTPGFLGFELLRPVAGESRYFIYTKWESEEAYQAWATGPTGHRSEAGRPPVVTGANLLEFEVVQQVSDTH